MFKKRLSTRNLVIGLVLTAVLVSLLTFVVFAQTEPEDAETGILPEKITLVEEEELEIGSRATSKFMFIPASTFVPRDDDMTFVYDGAGCIYRTGGTYFSQFSVQLPEGAEIDFIRLYFYDNNPTYDARVELYTYDGFGSSDYIKMVKSSGIPGQSSIGSGFFSHVVQNTTEALSLTLIYETTGTTLKICGVRIRYQYSGAFGTFLPFVTR